jgi:hypothetical protein
VVSCNKNTENNVKTSFRTNKKMPLIVGLKAFLAFGISWMAFQ